MCGQSNRNPISSTLIPVCVCLFTDKFPQFDVVNIPSDGNCQFAAIAFHLGGNTSARDVRQTVVQYLQSSPTILYRTVHQSVLTA